MSNSIIEEYIYELTRAVGDSYMAVTNGVGTIGEPGTALFELNQISSLARASNPYFGILETTPSGFVVTEPGSGDTSKEVLISAGTIAYNNQVIYSKAQRLRYTREFAATYNTDDTYGVCLGIPLSEVQAVSAIHTTQVSVVVPSGSSVYELEVDDIQVAINLGFPLKAYVDNELIFIISGNNGKLQLDPQTLGMAQPHGINAQVYFIYEPRVKAICGLPVGSAHQSLQNPNLFSYYPPIPKDWLQIAKFLVEFDRNSLPQIVTGTIVSLVVDWPASNSGTPIFSDADAKAISAAANTAKVSLKRMQGAVNVNDIVTSLESYTNQLDNALTFKEYWGTKPFSKNNYFVKGVSFDNLARFEFPYSFAQAYYSAKKSDLQHTFAIFRGDLYQHNALTDTIPRGSPIPVTITSGLASGIPSTLRTGMYVYDITTVNSSGQEINPTYVPCISALTNSYVNEIKYTNGGEVLTNVAYYNIYRKANFVGNQVEYKLTQPNQITSLTPSIGSDLLPTTGVVLDQTLYYAIMHKPDTGILVGGAGIYLRFEPDTIVANTEEMLEVSLYEYDAGITSTIGNLVSAGTPIYFSEILSSATYKECKIRFDATCLDVNKDYWIVIKMSDNALDSNYDPTIDLLLGQNAEAPPSDYIMGSTADFGVALDLGTVDTCYKIYGYLDNGSDTGLTSSQRGIKITGVKALTPSRLRVYVPEIDTTGISADPFALLTGSSGYSGYDANSTNTRNELLVTVNATNSITGVQKELTTTVATDSVRGTEFLLGTETDIFDTVTDVYVSPGTNCRINKTNGQINWSIYDLITVETTL
jgi:hypothetical protein